MKLALLIEYDGTEFAGWQSQHGVRTVQDELEAGFLKIIGRRVVVHGAGRTDTGVHARGMVAHIEVQQEEIPDLPKVLAGINATTGRDLVVLDMRKIDDDFHARHSARSRQYRYSIHLGRLAIGRSYVWATHYKLDFAGMLAASGMLIGEHDFTAFSKRSEHVEHYRCIVEHAEWKLQGKRLEFTIRANRFVRGMVRGLVGAMVEIGRGNSNPQAFQVMLSAAEPLARALYLAPARGLVLERVRYPEHFGLWQ